MKKFTSLILIIFIITLVCFATYSLGQIKAKETNQIITPQNLVFTPTSDPLYLLNDPYINQSHLQLDYPPSPTAQQIREICAFNIKTSNSQWAGFLHDMQSTCTADNINTCWQDQARTNGFSTSAIITCFTNYEIKR